MTRRSADLRRADAPPVSSEGPAADNPAPSAAGPEIRPFVTPIMTAVGLAVAWILLATHSPATTYHFAPLLIVVTPAWVGRHGDQRGASTRLGIAWIVVGVAIATVTTVLLATTGNLAGPTLTGTAGAAPEEAVMVIMFGSLVALGLLRWNTSSSSRGPQRQDSRG
jgi:hypothetical protein